MISESPFKVFPDYLIVGGSRLTGVNPDGDIDLLGFTIEDYETYMRLNNTFEQEEYRTQKRGKRSDPETVEGTMYSLRKFARLAAQGNPNILEMLFAHYGSWVVTPSALALRILENSSLFVSRAAGPRYLGYAKSQMDRVVGHRAVHTNRPELIAAHGYDAKAASHVYRLLAEGIMLMNRQHIELPLYFQDRKHSQEIRRGEWDIERFKRVTTAMIKELEDAIMDSSLPQHPRMDAINNLVAGIYWERWSSERG